MDDTTDTDWSRPLAAPQLAGQPLDSGAPQLPPRQAETPPAEAQTGDAAGTAPAGEAPVGEALPAEALPAEPLPAAAPSAELTAEADLLAATAHSSVTNQGGTSPTYPSNGHTGPTYRAPSPYGYSGQPTTFSTPLPASTPYPLPVPWALPAYPAPAARAPRVFGLTTVVTVAAVAALLACIGGAVLDSVLRPAATAATATHAPGASQPATTPPVVAPGDGQALLARVLPLPKGATPVAGMRGALDLDTFVQRFFPTSTNEHALLEARDFRFAASAGWVGVDGVEVHIQVAEFGAAEGASGFALGQIGAYRRDPLVTGEFAVPVGANGTGFEKSALDAKGNRRAILIMQDGPLNVMMFFFTPGDFDRQAEIALMREQLDSLAG